MSSRIVLCVLLFVIGDIAWSGATPKQPSTAKASHVVVRVTGPDAVRPAEVAIAIDPTNPDRLVAVCQQGGRGIQPPGNRAYYSDNGGHAWKEQRLPKVGQRGEGDDVVAIGSDNVAYRACISFSGLRQVRPARAATGVYVTSSKNGLDWGQPVAVVDRVNSVEPFEDKPGLAVDTVSDSSHRGNVYVAWTRFDVYGSKDAAHKSHIHLSRSRDAGQSFSPIIRVSDRPGDCRDSSDTVMGATIAVGSGGEVFVAWAGPEGIVFDKSTDGGATFGADSIITKTPGGWDIPAAGLVRHNGCPVLGVDLSNGQSRGSIYAGWIDRRHGDPDVFVMASRDGGGTWSEPVRVNDDPIGNGKDQLFAAMAIDPADGSINLIFFDRRELADTMTGVTMARSVDGGRSFVNHRVKQESFACHKDVFLGDYNGIAAVHGRVVAVYSHFVGRRELAISAAIFRFKLGTQEPFVD